VFLSQSSYLALHRLRKEARIAADQAVTAEAAHGTLAELEKIWSYQFELDGKSHYPLATALKNDLGSYAQAALSQ
jgi:hypothetical protein